jgi:hypothetical protein
MCRRFFALPLMLTTIAVLSATGLLAADYGEHYFKFKTPVREQLDKISRLISIDAVTSDEVRAYANDAELARFEQLGIAYYLLPHPGTLIRPRMATAVQDAEAWDSYPTYDAYVAIMNQFQIDFPGLCQIVNAGSTVNGRAILFARISDNVTAEEDEPEVMYTGTMHGDETTGYILSLRLIDSLLHGYGVDPYTTRLVDSMEIWINPLANPDGTYYSGNSNIYGARRYNANGVDINRNFPDPAEGDHPDGNSWQPETTVMMDFAEAHSIAISANFHGGAEVINYPWDTWARLHADNDWYYDICLAWASLAQAASPGSYMESTQFPDGITNGYAWYRVTGGRQDYMIYQRGGREITAEISNTKLLPAADLLSHWNYNRLGMLGYLENALYGIRGVVTDAATTLPVAATIRVLGHDRDNSQVFTDPEVGDYHRMLSAGTYDLAFSAPGYETDTVTGVVVSDGYSTVRNIALQPLSGTPDLAFVEHSPDLALRNQAVSMTVTLVNNGGGNASAVSSTLQTTDPYITVSQASSAFPTIPGLGGSGTSITNFVINISPVCPLNHVADMQLNVSASGGYSAAIPFALVVEPVRDGFEPGTFANLPWSNGESTPWSLTLTNVDEGAFSARSGVIGHNESSRLEIDVEVAQTGKLWFDLDVSSEGGYDFLRFYIDGVQAGAWSGEVSWTRVSYGVSAGPHMFVWEYSKDEAAVSGGDYAAIDRVIFPALISSLQIYSTSAPPSTVGRPYEYQLLASGRLGTAVWSDKNGDLEGSWLNLTSDGFLSGTPALAGSTSFTARVEDAAGSPDEALLTVTINSLPEITTLSLPVAERNSLYSVQLDYAHGTPPMIWTETSGILTGTGLSLTSNGQLSGNPSVDGVLELHVGLTDYSGAQTSAILPLTITGGCCFGKVGDANQSGQDEPTIGDISVLIDMLFISGTPVTCLAEADVNQSGGAEPTVEDITIGDVSILIDHIFISGVALPDCI